MKTKMHDHIVALMRKAFNAGYREGYDTGNLDGSLELKSGNAILGGEFDEWMATADGVPRIGPPRFQPIVVVMALRIQSRANLREHWRKRAARTKAEKLVTSAHFKGIEKPALPVKVTLTRVSPRFLDGDNLQGGMKAVRDAVAEWLGADDKPGSGITWAYAQCRGEPKTYAAQILIEPGEA
jgi:hypothetical protein